MTISHRIGTAEMTINGTRTVFDAQSIIIQGRTLVPVRMIAEAVGAEVEWIATSRTVAISTALSASVNVPQTAVSAPTKAESTDAGGYNHLQNPHRYTQNVEYTDTISPHMLFAINQFLNYFPSIFDFTIRNRVAEQWRNGHSFIYDHSDTGRRINIDELPYVILHEYDGFRTLSIAHSFSVFDFGDGVPMIVVDFEHMEYGGTSVIYRYSNGSYNYFATLGSGAGYFLSTDFYVDRHGEIFVLHLASDGTPHAYFLKVNSDGTAEREIVLDGSYNHITGIPDELLTPVHPVTFH